MKAQFSIDRARAWIVVAALAVVTLISFWALQTIRNQGDQESSRKAPRSEPDYYVENFNFIKLSNNGKANYHVTGTRLSHLPANDQYEIFHPVIHTFDDEKTPITMRSERALVEQKSDTGIAKREHDLVHMYDQVQVDRRDNATGKTMRLETEYLELYPDSDMAKTNLAVKLISENSETNAVGMVANNATQQIEFISQVHIRLKSRQHKSTSNDKNS